MDGRTRVKPIITSRVHRLAEWIKNDNDQVIANFLLHISTSTWQDLNTV